MALNKRQREKMRNHCGQLNSDDAVDPREYFRSRHRKDDIKTLRLCKQVEECLSFVLASEFEDELLHSLQIVSVQPAPDAKRMMVLVSPDADVAKSSSPIEVIQKLELVSGRLRTEVASSIHRKRAPTFAFQVIWPVELTAE